MPNRCGEQWSTEHHCELCGCALCGVARGITPHRTHPPHSTLPYLPQNSSEPWCHPRHRQHGSTSSKCNPSQRTPPTTTMTHSNSTSPPSTSSPNPTSPHAPIPICLHRTLPWSLIRPKDVPCSLTHYDDSAVHHHRHLPPTNGISSPCKN